MGQETSTNSSGTIVAAAIVAALAVICVALRFYTRIRTKAGIAWDDWWILISLLTSLLIGGLLFWGKSTSDLKTHSSSNYLKAATQIQMPRARLVRPYSPRQPTHSTPPLIQLTSSSPSYFLFCISSLSPLSKHRSCLCTAVSSL